jgi:hypothetical protein
MCYSQACNHVTYESNVVNSSRTDGSLCHPECIGPLPSVDLSV